MEEILGDLLTSDAQYIVHQCNAQGTHPAGLAAAINMRFPFADIYSHRKASSIARQNEQNHPEYPGNIVIRGNGTDQRFVICAMGQFYPGGPADRGEFDSSADREKWFRQCLEKMQSIPDLKSIAFPFQIGCGIAGGNWTNYHKMIADFADLIGIPVTIINPNNKK